MKKSDEQEQKKQETKAPVKDAPAKETAEPSLDKGTTSDEWFTKTVTPHSSGQDLVTEKSADGSVYKQSLTDKTE